MSLPLRLWDNLMLISNLRSKQDPCSLSCYVHVTMHKSTSFFLCRASLKEGFWGETLSMCGHCLAFELSLLLMNGFYKIVVWTTMICIDIFICLWENLLDLSTDENATKFWLDYEQMTSNCCNMGRVKHDYSWNTHSTCGKNFPDSQKLSCQHCWRADGVFLTLS